MENQSFKTQLKQAVKEYLDIDNEIATLQKALKERKSKKEKLSKLILGTMKTQDIQQMNINNEKLVYQVTQYKTPLTKPYLNTVLKDFFKSEEKADTVIEHILGNRTRVEKVKLKRVGEKKKNLTISE
tara:strand:- start:712 stop:1095 length:384 start_codon:yes stop_codon:yes gene_type:complete